MLPALLVTLYFTAGLIIGAVVLRFYFDRESAEYQAFKAQPIFLLLGFILLMFVWPYAIYRGLRDYRR